ncbi:hypothetical protein [Neolewinella sp.]|uniref:hypothetical protein n=1 Tax=Neolewinella sp. TaxID=2993543 RepID=UPI003B5169BA
MMAISYTDVRDQRQWRAATGLTQAQFTTLVDNFAATYEDFLGETINQHQAGSSGTAPSTFTTYADLVFFLLYSIKSGLTYDLIGLSFGLDRANAFRNQTFGLRILQMTLQRSGHMPKRFYESLEEFHQQMEEHETILLDGTEQRRQRPGNE